MSLKFNHLSVLILMLALGLFGCKKHENLFEKAFQDKSFGQAQAQEQEAAPVDSPLPEEPPKEPRLEEVRDEKERPPVESVFLPSGTTERVVEDLFPVDPPAPALNSEEATVYEIIQVLCNMMKVNYIIDPAVADQAVTIGMTEAKVTMKTSELLELILKLHNLTYEKQGEFIRILPLDSPEIAPGLDLLYGSMPNEKLMREEFILQIVPLKYVKASEIANIIKEFLSAAGRIVEYEFRNVLIVVDKANFVAKVLELIPIFDVSTLHDRQMMLFNLNYVDAVELMPELQGIVAAYGYSEESTDVQLIPIETLNAVLVISRHPDIFSELRFWIDKLDKEAQFEEPQIFIYHVQNSTADIIASTLGQLQGLSASSIGTRNSQSASNRTTNSSSNRRTMDPTRDANSDRNRTTPTNQPETQNFSSQLTNSQQGSEVNMVVDQENNAIIFYTTPKEYQKLLRSIKRLDVLPRQVFLEVTIFTVDLSDDYKLGFDWSGSSGQFDTNPDPLSFTGNLNNRSGSFNSESGGAFTYSFVGLTEALTAKLIAAKNKGYTNILQQPHIMAIDNKEATITVGQDVPIETNRFDVPNTGTTNIPYTTTNIQYRQTGVSLTVTPHINANGLIRMQLNLDISSLESTTDTSLTPPVNQTKLMTEMIVRDGQTVVMGGLIDDLETGNRQSVPLLGKIPLLRHLFSNKSSTTSRNELVVMITPKVIDSEKKSIEVSKEFSEKIHREYQKYIQDEM